MDAPESKADPGTQPASPKQGNGGGNPKGNTSGKQQQPLASATAPTQPDPNAPHIPQQAPYVAITTPRQDIAVPKPATAPAKPVLDPYVRDNLQPMWRAEGLRICPVENCGYCISPTTGLCTNGGAAHGAAAPYTPRGGNRRTITLKQGGDEEPANLGDEGASIMLPPR